MNLKLEEEYTCNDFEEMSKGIENLRTELLFNFNEAGCSPLAEQHYLMSLNTLELAYNHMKMAMYYQMKVL